MEKTTRTTIVFFFALVLAIYIGWLARDVLLLIYVSALFAVVISPAVRLIRRIHIGSWRPGRGQAIIALVIGGALLMAVLFALVLPPIVRDAHGLAQDWPHRISTILQRAQSLPFLDRLDPSALQQHVGGAVGGAVGVFKGVAGGLFWFFSWLILTAYFILDGDRAFSWAMTLVPVRTREKLEPTLLKAERRVRHWLVGQGALMLCLGVSSGLAFGLMHVRYFYALALFAGVTNIVPIVGPVASLALACVVAAVDSWTKVIGVLAFYLVYQQVENAFLTPRIMKTTVDLPPLAVIIALSLGGALAGVLGALVAVPTAALVAVLIEEYVVRPHQEQFAAKQAGTAQSA
jgi:predicted PurR-regulated permease PerM